jgi:hypothetical protein
MSGHTPFSELTKRFSPERLAAIEAEKNRLLEQLALQEKLCESLHIQPEELGAMLGLTDPDTEQRNDTPLSSLREAIEAMGGELVITARFPDVEVCLSKG